MVVNSFTSSPTNKNPNPTQLLKNIILISYSSNLYKIWVSQNLQIPVPVSQNWQTPVPVSQNWQIPEPVLQNWQIPVHVSQNWQILHAPVSQNWQIRYLFRKIGRYRYLFRPHSVHIFKYYSTPVPY